MAGVLSSQNPDAEAERRVGSVIKGKWTLDALLGVGGMAAVYSASHRNGKRVALKVLHVDYARDRTVCDRFLREAYVCNRVGHESVVQILDDDVTDAGELFLVMELLEGETIRDTWKNHGKTVPFPLVFQICERVLDCLAACHSVGIVHRDLKPANIFLTRDLCVKLLDFGVAQYRDAQVEKTTAGTALGTPAYMAPEQAMGLVDEVDARADVFAVGALIHALVTGYRINHGRTEQEALVMAATRAVPSVSRLAPTLPIEVIRIVDKALQWDKKDRFTSARDMQAAVVDVMARHGVPPMPAVRAGQVLSAAGPSSAQLMAAAAIAPAERPSEARPGASAVMPTASARAAFDSRHDVALEHHLGLVKQGLRAFERAITAPPNVDAARLVQAAFDPLTQAVLENRGRVVLSIGPNEIFTQGRSVYRPEQAKAHGLVTTLFGEGVREITIDAGITADELSTVVSVVRERVTRDDLYAWRAGGAPRTDLATALWERDLAHVEFTLADPVETVAWRAETTALPAGDVTVHRQVLEALFVEADAYVARDDAENHDDVSSLALDPQVAHAIGGKFRLDPAEAGMRSLRMITSLGELGDVPWAQAALVQLGASAVIGGFPEQVADYDEVLGLDGEHDDHSLVRRATVRTALVAWALPGGGFVPEASVSFGELLEGLPAEAASDAIYGFGSLRWGASIEAGALAAQNQIATMLLQWISDHATPQQLGEAMGWAPYILPTFVARWVVLVAKLGGSVSDLRGVDVPSLRLAADLFVTSERDPAQIAHYLDGTDEALRATVIDCVCTFVKPWCFGALARIIASPRLLRLTENDRRRVMAAAMHVAPREAELVLFELVKKTTLLGSGGEHHATRIMAVDVIGELCITTEAQLEMDRLVQARSGVSDDLRAAAQRAAMSIRERRQAGSTNNPFGVR